MITNYRLIFVPLLAALLVSLLSTACSRTDSEENSAAEAAATAKSDATAAVAENAVAENAVAETVAQPGPGEVPAPGEDLYLAHCSQCHDQVTLRTEVVARGQPAHHH